MPTPDQHAWLETALGITLDIGSTQDPTAENSAADNATASGTDNNSSSAERSAAGGGDATSSDLHSDSDSTVIQPAAPAPADPQSPAPAAPPDDPTPAQRGVLRIAIANQTRYTLSLSSSGLDKSVEMAFDSAPPSEIAPSATGNFA
ncbi:MAG TPA: hypothetical protein VG328_06800, partial [Stellaceae bacterium]|nr:hypothetical protein [Stellaceae bacterium]